MWIIPRAAGVSLQQVMDAVEKSNLNVGGKVIEENGMEFVVRGLGLNPIAVPGVSEMKELLNP